MYRAVSVALSAMPMGTLALVSLGLGLVLVGGAQGNSGPLHATKGCLVPGQRQAVGYPLVCDPAYKANTKSGVGKGSEPRCKVSPVLTCKDATPRRKYAASPALYRAGPWAEAAARAQAPRAEAPRAHVPVQHERKMSPKPVITATPAKVASSPSGQWEEVTEFKKPVTTTHATRVTSPHRSSSSSSSRPSASVKWEKPRSAARAPVATRPTSAHRSSSSLPSSSGGQWEEVTVL